MTSRIQNKNTKQKTTYATNYFSVKSFNVFLLGLIILIGFFYLLQVNSMAVKGYVIRDLEVKLEDAKMNNRNLQLQSQGLQSVGGLATKTAELGMVTVDKVEYLQGPGSSVAVAK